VPLLSHADESDASWAAKAVMSDHANLSRRQVYAAGTVDFVQQLQTFLTEQQLPAQQYFTLQNTKS